MKSARIGSLLLAMLLTLSAGLPASAQSAWEELEQALGTASEAYQRAYIPTGAEGSDLPTMGAVVLIMGSETEAKDIYDLFIEMSEEDEYQIESLDGLGDQAALIVEPSPDTDENIVMAQSGAVVAIVVSDADTDALDLQKSVASFILLAGPSEEEVVVDDLGAVTGGWADAFPEPNELNGLESYEATPVIQFGLTAPPTAATVSLATPAGTSADPTMNSETGMTMSYVQSYLNLTDEALASDSIPEIVMTMLWEFETEADAERAYQEMTSQSGENSGGNLEFTMTEVDDLGDEAMFTESVDSGGDHGAWITARDGTVVMTAFVTGAPGNTEIGPDILQHVIETGPSDSTPTVDENGVITGGWAEAFPQPDDIEGLELFDPAPVEMVMPGPGTDDLTPPDVASPAA